MKEICRDGCRTSLLIAGVFLVPAIFHTLLPPCHPYITIHFMEMIFSTCNSYYCHCCDDNTSQSPRTSVCGVVTLGSVGLPVLVAVHVCDVCVCVCVCVCACVHSCMCLYACVGVHVICTCVIKCKTYKIMYHHSRFVHVYVLVCLFGVFTCV